LFGRMNCGLIFEVPLVAGDSIAEVFGGGVVH
jgi:hypothetical protein